MNFNVGDKVSFLNEKLDGVVTKILKNNTIEVTDANGFPIPVLATEIVKINNNEPEENSKSSKSIVNKDSIIVSQEAIFPGGMFFIAIKKSRTWDVYLFNNTSKTSYVQFRQKKLGEFILLYSGELGKGNYQKIITVNYEDISDLKDFFIQKLATDWSVKKAPQSTVHYLKISPRVFTDDNNLQKIEFLKSNGIPFKFKEETNVDEVFSLDDFNGIEIGKSKGKENQIKNSILNDDFIDEVDLHIEKLYPNWQKLNNSEIIEFQLKAAERAINKAIKQSRSKLILVHGKGKGILKDAIFNLVNNQYLLKCELVKSNEGATLIFLS